MKTHGWDGELFENEAAGGTHSAEQRAGRFSWDAGRTDEPRHQNVQLFLLPYGANLSSSSSCFCSFFSPLCSSSTAENRLNWLRCSLGTGEVGLVRVWGEVVVMGLQWCRLEGEGGSPRALSHARIKRSMAWERRNWGHIMRADSRADSDLQQLLTACNSLMSNASKHDYSSPHDTQHLQDGNWSPGRSWRG